MLRIRNMDTHKRARKNETIDATQNAPSRHTNEKKLQKDPETKKDKTSEDLNDIDSSCTDDESEDGKSDVSHKDQDSDVSFENDTDEEIDTTEIEMKLWKRWEMRRFDAGTRLTKNEMEIGAENSRITE